MKLGNRVEDVLSQWMPLKDSQQWVLGVIIDIKGSSYRKPGALMLFGEMGQQFGILSGGCLESDLMRHAKMVMDSHQAKFVTYDMTDEDDVGWQLGIGCGGMVKIILLPVNNTSCALALSQVYMSLNNRRNGQFTVPLTLKLSDSVRWYEANENQVQLATKIVALNAEQFSVSIQPRPHLAIFGGGIDAIPLVTLAHRLGWSVSVIDKRPAYARRGHFPQAQSILKQAATHHEVESLLTQVNAIVIMNHNMQLDGEALKVAQDSSADYIALLGPNHRRDKILSLMKMTTKDLLKPLSSPAGFDIGGELPESIALSILAECHAVIEGQRAIGKLAVEQ